MWGVCRENVVVIGALYFIWDVKSFVSWWLRCTVQYVAKLMHVCLPVYSIIHESHNNETVSTASVLNGAVRRS